MLKSDTDKRVSKYVVSSNLFWRLSERVLAQLIAFIVSIILARILDPTDYGTVTLITVFIAVFQVFVESGLGNALIQKKDADDLDFSTVFYTNIVFCICLYVLLFFSAPGIASFYKNLSLTAYIRVLGLTVLISGLKNVQQAYVSRNMLFRKFFFSTLLGTIIAGVSGIMMALNGLGIWALVAQQVINLSIDTLVLWITVKWRPIRSFSFERLWTLFSYGWKLLISGLLDTGYNSLRQLIIGKKYTSDDLAFYDRGEKYPHLIINNVNVSIDSVLLPAMSRVQGDPERVKSMTRRSIQVSTYIMAPLMMGMVFISEPLVRFMITDKWIPCVPFLRIFCITYMFYPIHTANLNAIKALGRSDVFLVLEIIKKSLGLIAILITMNISVEAMANSLLVMCVINLIINSWPNRKFLKYGYWEQLKDIIPTIFLALIMGVSVWVISFTGLPDFLILILQIFAGGTIYIGISKLLKIESYSYVISMMKNYINKGKEQKDGK